MVSKEEFIDKQISKLTDSYTQNLDMILNVISIFISLCCSVIMCNKDSELLLFAFSIILYIFTRFSLMFLFKGISLSSVPYMIFYIHSKINFFIFLHFITFFFAVLIIYLKLEFTIDGKDIDLSIFQSYYYVFSVITTVGSNIFPKSDEAIFLTMILSFVTFLFIIFMYSTLINKQIIKKSFINSAKEYLAYTYEEFVELFNEKELSEQRKEELLSHLTNHFNFNTPNGHYKVYYEMKRDIYPI